tara:strand:- start:41 stop:1669 length:1629 start_codon:yes stop_codon:yes gene_type:complete
MEERSEFIVVGGGAAGCAVTSKLLKANFKVTLFEAGYSNNNFLINWPAGFFKFINKSKFATYHKTKPQKHLYNRENIVPQANVLGGGTSINAQVYMRGRPEDYNEWNDILRVNNDNVDWSWDTLLPYFRNMETNSTFNNEHHSQEGPLQVSHCDYINELTHDFINSVATLGVEVVDDFNGENPQKGVGYYQFMNNKGQRSSAANAYIDPEKNNPNLDLRLNSTIKNLIFENNKVIGVEFVNNKGIHKKHFAEKEVILATGSLITPKILMLSGIGDEKELSEKNIKCLQHLPGVGKNLMDHPECPLIAKANGKYGYFKQGEGWRMIKNGLEFLINRTGPINSVGVEAGAFINPINSSDLSYIQAFFVPSIYMNADTIGVVDPDYGMSITTVMTKPKSRGYVKLKSSNYEDPPEINLNLLKHPEDLKMMVAGQRFFLKSLKQGPLGDKVEKIILPDQQNLDDEKIAEHCKKFVRTNYHPAGTAKMGADNDALSVLDSKMRVRGIENLRVCDMSAMPVINSGNTSAPAMMLGLRCGDFLTNDINK